MEKRFPDKETPLLVACSDGTTYALDALEALDEAGYTNLVGLKGESPLLLPVLAFFPVCSWV